MKVASLFISSSFRQHDGVRTPIMQAHPATVTCLMPQTPDPAPLKPASHPIPQRPSAACDTFPFDASLSPASAPAELWEAFPGPYDRRGHL